MKIEVGEEGTENEIRESGLDPANVSDVGDLDDDGRPKRTGTLSLSLSLSVSHVLLFSFISAYSTFFTPRCLYFTADQNFHPPSPGNHQENDNN